MDDPRSTIERYAGKVFDWALYGVLFVMPLFMGGRGPVGKFVFVCFVSLMTLAWGVESLCRKSVVLRFSGAEWIILGGALLLVVQLLPLPESILLAVSPNHRELLPVWFSSPAPNHFQIGTWNTISLAPSATREALAIYLAYALFFILLIQRIRTCADVQWLMRCTAMATVGLAFLGLTQFLAGNGKFLWCYEHPFRTTAGAVKGPFQNQNHFAHMMALGIGPLLWTLVTAVRVPSFGANFSRSRRRFGHPGARDRAQPLSFEVLCITFGVGIVALAAMLTFSRGGFLAFIVATLVALGLFHWQNLGNATTLKLTGGVATLIVIALGIYGFEPLARRLATFQSSQSLEDLSHGRHALWDSMLAATHDFWLTGTGFASHRDVYPVYMENFYSVEFTHGESCYLPLLMEGGVLAILLLGAAIAVLACRLLSSLHRVAADDAPDTIRNGTLAAPVCAAIVASLIHAGVDFAWYITTCMAYTLVLLAIAMRLPDLVPNTSRRPAERRSPKGLLVAFLCWNRQHRISASTRTIVAACGMGFIGYSAATMLPAARGSAPWNEFRRVTRSESLGPADRKHREIQLLQETLVRNPVHRKAGIILAQAIWQTENSPIGSETAVGERDRSAQSLALTVVTQYPLLGSGYAFAAPHSAFFETSAPSEALIQQALRVRQHDALVHMLRGRQLLAAGQLDDGFRHWRFAFNHDPTVQSSLIEQLRPIFPASFLIEKLQPQTAGLWQLYYAYRAATEQENTAVVAQQLIHQLEIELAQPTDSVSDARSSYSLYSLYDQIDAPQQAIYWLQRAVDSQPDKYSYRRSLAIHLYRQKRYEQAERHLKWCQTRRPGDRPIAKMLKAATRQQIASTVSDARHE
ncbi:O-antigen ligase family protein [Rosistilla oblonga]|uniref:O-antigen ligase family protein n=1 Tax=Rosistilla oblonga TaxID=2527990 RepID=UPI003A974B33